MAWWSLGRNRTPPTREEQAPRSTSYARRSHAIRSPTATQAPLATTIPRKDLEHVYRECPPLKRGIDKSSGDAVKLGFTITTPEGEEHPLNAEVQEWCRRVDLKSKLRQALIDAHIYGDGLLELDYDDEGAATDPVPGNATLVDVHVIDPIDIEIRIMGGERFLTQRRTSGGPEVTFHPDRWHHVRVSKSSGHAHGIPTTHTAWHASKAWIKGLQGMGEILYHSGIPVRHYLTDPEASDAELDDLAALLSNDRFKRGFVWRQPLEVQQHNPQVLDPEPYYAELLNSIAGAVGIPAMMLVGAQAGAVTGSETNLDDYHSDLQQLQENILTPIIERVVFSLHGLLPEAYDVEWHPFPRNDLDEAQSIRERVAAFGLLVNAGVTAEAAARETGLGITEDEVRSMADAMAPEGL